VPKMLKNVLKNLFSKPATVDYPYVKPDPVPGTRGRISFDMARCDQCQDCERLCPSGAIKVFPEAKRVEYDPFRCLYCHLCVENCMQKAIVAEEVSRSPEYEKSKDVFED
jgi:ech hydrogenase subunit F